MQRLLVINTILAALPCILFAQQNNNDLQYFDNSSGLSNSAINKVFADSDQLLWIGTWDGLNMFDGTRFHVFNYGQSGTETLNSNVILDITEGKNGDIWIATIQGVSRYEKSNGRITNYFSNAGAASSYREHEFRIARDQQGNIYALSRKNGFAVFDSSANQFASKKFPFQHNEVRHFAFDGENKLIVLDTEGHLWQTRSRADGFDKGRAIHSAVLHLFIVEGNAWYQDSSFTLHANLNGLSREVSIRRGITQITPFHEKFCISYAGNGMTLLDEFLNHDSLSGTFPALQNVRITSTASSDLSILWAGTDGSGVIKITREKNKFTTVRTPTSFSSHIAVRSFAAAGGDLWTATKGGGIIRYHAFWENALPRKENIVTPVLENNSVYKIHQSRAGHLLIGSDAQGLMIYDTRRNAFHKWNAIQGSASCPEFGSVYDIFEDADGSVWVSTSGYGLLQLNITQSANGKFSVYCVNHYQAAGGQLANDIIYSVAPAGNNLLYIACRYGGLSVLNKTTGQIQTFKAFAYESSLSNNDILYVLADRENRLWVGTSYGLNVLENASHPIDKPTFKVLTTANGLPNNTVHGIVQDESGAIWISTNNGIAKIKWPEHEIALFQYSDGLQSNEFSDGAIWKDQDGQLFMGGIAGFNHFYPDKLSGSRMATNLLISDMEMGESNTGPGRFYVLGEKGSAMPRQYTLERTENFFSLRTSAIDFHNAEKQQYRYKLEGYDKNWIDNKNNSEIRYSNIAPGRYTLLISWSNGEGDWTSPVAVFDVHVKQFPWLTPWAFGFYLLVFLGIIYAYFQYKRNQAAIRQKLEIEHLKRINEERVHENRIGFFTNIAHELQTPLTLIIGGFERFLDKNATLKTRKDNGDYFAMFTQQASKLTFLLHQLFEFRRADSGFSTNSYTYLDISEFLANLVRPFQLLCQKKDIALETRIQPGMQGKLEKDKIEKTFYNLLLNAYKYTSPKERILFEAESVDNLLQIRLFNSGAQLSKAELETLFERFYSAPNYDSDKERLGTGIGLAFVKQLVNLMQATIEVKNVPDGLLFELSIPVEKSESPHIGSPLIQSPSNLYRAVTSFTQSKLTDNTERNNRNALFENVQKGEREIIVIIDDEDDIRLLLKDILADEYLIYEASNAAEGLELVSRYHPHLVISDIIMPGVNGLELCNKIKSTPATCHIPVLMLSAKITEEQHIQGYEAGADAYISKPFNTRHLKVRIKRLIQYRQLLQDSFKKGMPFGIIDQPGIKEEDKSFLNDLLGYINKNLLDPDLSATTLEKTFFMSRMQLYRKMKSLTGMTPNELIKDIRLQKAAALLSGSNLSVTDIFYQTGFRNQSYFFREFRKKFDCPPNEYREKQHSDINS